MHADAYSLTPHSHSYTYLSACLEGEPVENVYVQYQFTNAHSHATVVESSTEYLTSPSSSLGNEMRATPRIDRAATRGRRRTLPCARVTSENPRLCTRPQPLVRSCNISGSGEWYCWWGRRERMTVRWSYCTRKPTGWRGKEGDYRMTITAEELLEGFLSTHNTLFTHRSCRTKWNDGAEVFSTYGI